MKPLNKMLDNMIVEIFSRILQNNLGEIYGQHFTVNRVDFFNIKNDAHAINHTQVIDTTEYNKIVLFNNMIKKIKVNETIFLKKNDNYNQKRK